MKDKLKKYSDLDSLMGKFRPEYSFGKLEEKKARRDPFLQFAAWFEEALGAKLHSVNAMALSTANRKGRPSSRMLLLKSFDQKGFIFYTHYDSHKAKEIAENPQAQALFFWPKLERQVRISGRVVKISRAESERYFASRFRASQIAAWLSHQSRPVKNRAALDADFLKLEKKFRGGEISCPPFWGGYCLIPAEFEFWQGRASRLNDRLLYKKSGKNWKITRLQP